MSRSDWLSDIAIGGCVVVGVLLGFNFALVVAGAKYPCSQYASAEAQNAQSSQGYANRDSVAGLNKQNTIDTNINQPDCENPKNANEADLCEQRRMARAAEEASCMARVQTWLNGFGIGLIVLSLCFTGVAAIAAADSAKAAVKANRLTRELFFTEQRPWIEVVSVDADGPLEFNVPDGTGRLKVSFHVRNSGKSPAHWLRVHFKLTISDVKDLLTQQRRYAAEVKARIETDRQALDETLFEQTMFPDRCLKTVRRTAEMSAEDLSEFRQWAQQNAPDNPVASVGLIGCVTYRSPIDEDLHQTAIIKRVHYKPTPTANFVEAIELTGTYPQDTISLRKSPVGSGPAD